MARRPRRDDKKLRNANLEKKNWIILNPGDLQKKDEEGTELGVRQGPTIEKEKTLGELWFGPARDDRMKAPAGAGTTPIQGRASSQGSSGRNESEEPSAEPESGVGPGRESQGQQVTATLKELDTRGPLISSDQKEGSLRDLFNSRPVSALPEAARPGPGSGRAPGSGGSLLLEGGRRNAVTGPSTAEGLGAGSRGAFGNGAGSFGSGFQSPFGNSPAQPNNRIDFAPGSSRSTFDPVRRQ